MELENLKEAWTALDNRLKRNEELNEIIILEMMKSKAGKLVNRFIGFEIMSIVVLLLVIPFCIFLLNKFGGKFWSMDVYLFFAIAVCSCFLLWGAYKLYGLLKIDLQKNVSNNILYVNKYNIQLKREKKITDCFVGPVFLILLVFYLVAIKVKLSMWFFVLGAISATVLLSFWSYKIYQKNIASILRSLDEIRELKEEF